MKSTIKKPVIIIGCPRSGTTLLFRILSESRELYSLHNESRFIFKKFYKKNKIKFTNDALSENDLNEENKNFLLEEFHKYTIGNSLLGIGLQKVFLKQFFLKPFGNLIVKSNDFYKNTFLPEYRMVEKTPRNCFKISFLNKLFPDAVFVFLKRDGRSNISSLIEGWKKRKGGKPRTPELNLPLNIKGYEGKSWHFVLPPMWENYREKTLEEVCAFQWVSSNEAALNGLEKISNERKITISYEEMSENTGEIIKNICDFADISFSGKLKKMAEKPPIVNTFSKPDKNKWKKHEKEMENIFPQIEKMMTELGYYRKDLRGVK